MYFPLITKKRSSTVLETKRADRSTTGLHRRKGGGGGGKGGGGGGSGGKSGGGSSGAGGGGGARSSGTINTGGTSRPASAFGRGGGPQTTIPSGQLFAGRTQGGGTRDQVYGNQQYGSGYPGATTRGVAGRGFPFYFWPIPFAGVAAVGGGAYLYDHEYGSPDNSSRPGGIMISSNFASVSVNNNTYRFLADNETSTSLLDDINLNCGSLYDTSTLVSSNYSDSFPLPKPEQVVQYYRASSVALALDGYNNTSVFEAEGTLDVALPSNIDTALLNCLNTTIGAAVPLVDGASLRIATPPMGVVGLAYLLWCLSSLI